MAASTSCWLKRGRTPVLLPVLGVVFLLSQLVVCDIHRAKTHTGKVSPYPGSQQRGSSREKSSPLGLGDAADDGTTGTSADSQSELIPARGLEAWVCALLATTLVGMTGIFPLLLPIDVGPDTQDGDGAARFKCLLSFAVGGLLGDVFFHLMPEAWSHLAPDDHSGQVRIGIWVLGGIFTFLVLEKMFGDDENEERKDKDSLNRCIEGSSKQEVGRAVVYTALPETRWPSSETNGHALILPENNNKPKARRRRKTKENGKDKGGGKKVANGWTANGCSFIKDGQEASVVPQRAGGKETTVKVTGYLNLLANFIDNFTHGLAVAGSFLVSNKVGLLTTAAILLHEVPHEIGDFAILLRSGFNRWQAAKAQVCTATGGLCGALLALMSESAEKAGDSAAWILPFTSGGFLNIALVTVLPDLLEETNPRESIKQIICLLCGIAVMGAVNLIVD